MAKKTRNRQPKPEPLLIGMSLAQWQAEPDLLLWAQQDANFKRVLAVLTTERQRVMRATANDVGAAALTGARVEGYQEALNVLALLARGAEKPPSNVEATYETSALGGDTSNEVHD